tara:strand:+ start:999 stop:2276 length:1278 start_codon:yes stop_codon:yes gene_type:complete
MTVQRKQAEKFYQKLQKKFSRRINLDRSRIFLALKKFNIDPNEDLSGEVLQIIGSDGKNTVVQSLKSILLQNKKSITTFTSPAIISPLDRIFIKNEFISLKKFKNISQKIMQSKVKLTLFEAITLVYIECIKNIKNIDYYINEAGCGWNKDSTNLFDKPKAQIITNLNLQHKDLLGAKNIYDICKIKCGSLSNKTSIYIGKQNPKTLKIIKKILKKNPSQKYYYGKDFKIKRRGNYYLYSDRKGILKVSARKIISDGLWENIALTIKVARDLNISNKIILKALPKIRLLGRLQFIKKGKLRKLLFPKEDLLLDGCHSENSVKNHVKFLKSIDKPKYAIWSLMKNREPKKYIKHLKCFKKIVTIKVPGEPNSCSPKQLKKIADQNRIRCVTAPNIKSAIKTISSNETKCLSIIGSLYTAGKVLNLN